MKKLALIMAILLTTTLVQAETLVKTYTGKLRGTTTKVVNIADLKNGQYRYELKLTGAKRAKAYFTISQKRLSGIWTRLLKVGPLKTRRTHEGVFNVRVVNIVGHTTNGTRKVKFKVTKKIGPRQINFVLKIYKK